jgi:hypothetical protein
MLIVSPDYLIGPFRAGDVPAPGLVGFIDDDGVGVDLPVSEDMSGTLTSPSGDVVALENVARSGTQFLTWDWPSALLLDEPGIWAIEFRVAFDPDTVRIPDAFVVDAVDGWLSLDDARRLWPDAPDDDVALFMLLESARIAVVSYAPAIPIPAPPAIPVIPVNYLQAQLAQTRAIWNMAQTSPQALDAIGFDNYAIRVYPLDYNIRQLIRPRSGRPVLW